MALPFLSLDFTFNLSSWQLFFLLLSNRSLIIATYCKWDLSTMVYLHELYTGKDKHILCFNISISFSYLADELCAFLSLN